MNHILVLLLLVSLGVSHGLKHIVGLKEKLEEVQRHCKFQFTYNSAETALEPVDTYYPVTVYTEQYRHNSKGGFQQQILKFSDHECTVHMNILIYEFGFLADMDDSFVKELGEMNDLESKFKKIEAYFQKSVKLSSKCADPCYEIFIQEDVVAKTPEAQFWLRIRMENQFFSYMQFQWVVTGLPEVPVRYNSMQRFKVTQQFFFCTYCMPQQETGNYELDTSLPWKDMQQFAHNTRKEMAWNKGSSCKEPSPTPGSLPFKHRKEFPNSNTKLDFIEFIEQIVNPWNKSLKFNSSMGGSRYPKSCSVIVPWENYLDSNHIQFEGRGFNFVTLHAKLPFWGTSKIFAIPFHLSAWIAIGIAILATAGLDLLRYSLKAKEASRALLLNAVMSNLIEVSASTEFNKLIRQNLSFKLVFCLWLLAGIVLTNGYKGVITTFLTSSWDFELETLYFNELHNFTFATPFMAFHDSRECSKTTSERYVKYERGGGYFESPICPPMTRHDQQQGLDCYKYPLFMSDFGDVLRRFGEMELYPSYKGKTYVFPSCMRAELIAYLKSEPKSVFITWADQIDDFLYHVEKEYPELKFYSGTDNFKSISRFWEITNIPNSAAEFRLKQLIENGFFKYWKYWLQDREVEIDRMKDLPDGAPVSLSRNSKVFFVFYIFLFGLLVAASFFLVEMSSIPAKYVWRKSCIFAADSWRTTKFRARAFSPYFRFVLGEAWKYLKSVYAEMKVWFFDFCFVITGHLVTISLILLVQMHRGSQIARDTMQQIWKFIYTVTIEIPVAAWKWLVEWLPVFYHVLSEYLGLASEFVSETARGMFNYISEQTSQLAVRIWEYLKSIDGETLKRFWNWLCEGFNKYLLRRQTSTRVTQLTRTQAIFVKHRPTNQLAVQIWEYLKSIDGGTLKRFWNWLCEGFNKYLPRRHTSTRVTQLTSTQARPSS